MSESEQTWYEEFVEEPIRPVVKLLRDNGINTTSSCGHAMTVEFDLFTGGDLDRVNDLLFCAGYFHFEIEAHWTTVPWPRRWASLRVLKSEKEASE